MSNIMDSLKLKNHVHRNGFDLSFKNCFTAKAGELLPIMCKEVIPGDKFDIDLSSLTRSMPVDSAAYTRLREYFDFYFVPDRLLWRFSDQFFIQQKSQSSAYGPKITFAVPEMLPYVSPVSLHKAVLAALDASGSTKENLMGTGRIYSMSKLLNYLDYGTPIDFFVNNKGQSASIPVPNRPMNLFPLLAYQKIYADYYRYSQWEDSRPYLYNVDYIHSSKLELAEANITAMDWSSSDGTMFDLRYANYNKDMFMGVLPSAQMGDVAVAAPLIGEQTFNSVGTPGSGTVALNSTLPAGSSSTMSGLGVSALSIRISEFLQKYKEIAISADANYKDQLKAHWNVDVSNDRSDLCRYLGGSANNINISEVVNTNLTASNAADILGKGVGAQNGHINFESHEHGVLMCIYHVVPLLDYQSFVQDTFNRKVYSTDFAIPELDSVGMQSLTVEDMFNYTSRSENFNIPLGYVPRYVDYKTSVDKIHGAFEDTLKNWVAPMTSGFLQTFFSLDGKQKADYSLFKVRPSFLDSIFAQAVGNDVNSDQFLINSFFDVKAVRNLDVHGLPY